MRDSNWLKEFACDITSQHGEDGMIAKIFEVITPKNKWCVEFGAWDGKDHSNTWNLIKNEDWKSVQIEPHKTRFAELLKTYDLEVGTNRVICLNKNVGIVPGILLDEILSGTPVPFNFDFLSIDIDSFDYQVWQLFRNYRPQVILIECCPDFRNGEFHIQDDSTKYFGSSLASITALGKEKGYELVGTIGVNAFFVLGELYQLFEIKNNAVSNYKIYTTSG